MTRDYVGEALGENKSWRDGIITAKDLQTKTFAPVRIILPQLIPEGVTIVAGKPKIGKSWLSLDVCLAVAGDRFVLGEMKPVHGDVLYLALEDNERRLKKRVDKILQSTTAPKSLDIQTEWKRVDQGGLEDIEAWCKEHPKRRLISIDTLAKIRPIAGRSEQAYAADYRAIEGLQKLAGEYQVGIVLNHHLRKASSEDDAFDDVSGTLGLTGSADTIIVMKRHSGMMKIFVRGRDIEEAEFAAEFDKNTCRWRLVGQADDVFRSQERQLILTALKDAARPMSVPELMAVTERHDRHALYDLLYKMAKAGDVTQPSRGQWAHSSNAVGIVGNDVITNHPFDNDQQKWASGFQRDSNGSGGVGIGVGIPEADKPLANHENSADYHHSNDSNGIEKVDDYPELPACLRRGPPEVTAMVRIRERWPPALGPGGRDDDVFDINPEWRQ
jgi:AAA domain-containing protein